MEARLEPLEGKYYGTRVGIYEGIKNQGEVVIWLNPQTEEGWKASPRELEGMHFGEEFDYCDNHYETTLAYQVATKLVEAINKEE